MIKNCFVYYHDDPDGSGAAAIVNNLIVSSGARKDEVINGGYYMVGSHETDYNDYGFNSHTHCPQIQYHILF